MKQYILFLCFNLFVILSAQINIQVMDYDDYKPIKGAKIYNELGEFLGKSDSLGFYDIKDLSNVNRIILYKEGYSSKYKIVGTENLIVHLIAENYKEKNIKDDLATEIINKMWQNEKINNIKRLKNYQFKSYLKGVIDGRSESLKYTKEPEHKGDDITNRLKEALDNNMIFISERGMLHKYDFRYGEKNILEVVRTSGLRENVVFYELMGLGNVPNEYPEVIHKNNMNYHRVKFIDSLDYNGRKTYLLYFHSIKNNGANSNESVNLYVDAESFSLVKMNGQTNKFGNIYYEIEWAPFQDTWYTKKEYVKFFFNDRFINKVSKILPKKYRNLAKIQGWINLTTDYFDFQSPVEFTKEEFDGYENEILENPKINVEEKLKDYRVVDLSEREEITYKVLDTFSKKNDLFRKAKIIHALTYGDVKMGKLDLDLFGIFSHNQYEGIRFQAALKTNSEFSKDIDFWGFIAKGTSDKDIKGGGGTDIFINKAYSGKLALSAVYNVAPIGREKLIYLVPKNIIESKANNVYNETYFSYKKIDLSYQQDFFKNMSVTFGVDYQNQRAEFDYSYKGESNDIWYNLTETYIRMKYAPANRYMQTPNGKVILRDKPPYYYLTLTKNWDIFENSISVQRIYFSTIHNIHTHLGRTQIVLNAGAVIGDTPIMNLHEGIGSAKNGKSVWARTGIKGYQSFETMHPATFFSNRFVAVFLSHKFKRMKVFPKKSINFTAIYNAMIGDLNHIDYHEGLDINVPNKFYQEVGLEANKVILGILGFGAYYRIGSYTNGAFDKNLYLKVMLNL